MSFTRGFKKPASTSEGVLVSDIDGEEPSTFRAALVPHWGGPTRGDTPRRGDSSATGSLCAVAHRGSRRFPEDAWGDSAVSLEADHHGSLDGLATLGGALGRLDARECQCETV